MSGLSKLQGDRQRPVLIGVAQRNQRQYEPSVAKEPVLLMADAVLSALSDAQAAAPTAKIAARLSAIGVIGGAWRYLDPARLLAENIGATDAHTVLTAMGGNTPQALLAEFCSRIQAGQLRSAIVVGGETIWSRRKQKKIGARIASMQQPPTTRPDETFGTELRLSTTFEASRGLNLPIEFYPLAESALRAQRGLSIEDHRDELAKLWGEFNKVATANPHAWNRRPLSAQEIREPTESNRMVGFPYTKAMNSNWDLDQACALLVCSVEEAERLGVPENRWVFPWASTEANDTEAVSHRRDLHSSPAIEAIGRSLFELTDRSPDTIKHVDLYSCFPVAVQVAAQELGLSLDRQLTLTGGLTFAGGPLNNYVTHSIAAMVDTLRHDPTTVGLVTANGGFLTKHAMGLYSTSPGPRPFKSINLQSEVDQIPRCETDESYHGSVAIEAYTILHDRRGPTHALCAVQTPRGARTWGRIDNAANLDSLMAQEGVGRSAILNGEGQIALI